MPIPDYRTLMKPLLQNLAVDPLSQRMQDVVEELIGKLNISEDQRQELLPSGQGFLIDNRISWARSYLKKAGLVENPKRGYVQITKRELDIVRENPDKIDNNFLNSLNLL